MTINDELGAADIFKHRLGVWPYRYSETERLSHLLTNGLVKIEKRVEECTRMAMFRLPGTERWYDSEREAIDAAIMAAKLKEVIG